MVAGYVSVMRYHTFCYRSTVISRNKHLWGGNTLPSSQQLLAKQLVHDLFHFVNEIVSFIDDVVADAFVEVLQNTEEGPCEESFEEIPPPEGVEASIICLVVDYFASQNAMPITIEITAPAELAKSTLKEVEIFDDEFDSLESVETSSEQSELSQSSEDWLASLEFVRDTEVRQHAVCC